MTMGPAPMMRMLLRSVRLGMVGHHLNKSVEQIAHVMSAGTGFRMPLKAERRRVSARDALQRAVEQRNVGAAQIGGQGRRIHRKTVILTGDRHPTAVEVLDRMVGAVVAELHLDGPGARGEGQQLGGGASGEGWRV